MIERPSGPKAVEFFRHQLDVKRGKTMINFMDRVELTFNFPSAFAGFMKVDVGKLTIDFLRDIRRFSTNGRLTFGVCEFNWLIRRDLRISIVEFPHRVPVMLR